MTYFKVVRRVKKNGKEKLVSALIGSGSEKFHEQPDEKRLSVSDWEVTYTPGVPAKGRYGTKVFIFSNYYAAFRWVSNLGLGAWEIWECAAENAERVEAYTPIFFARAVHLVKFWADRLPKIRANLWRSLAYKKDRVSPDEEFRMASWADFHWADSIVLTERVS